MLIKRYKKNLHKRLFAFGFISLSSWQRLAVFPDVTVAYIRLDAAEHYRRRQTFCLHVVCDRGYPLRRNQFPLLRLPLPVWENVRFCSNF